MIKSSESVDKETVCSIFDGLSEILMYSHKKPYKNGRY